MNAKYYFQDLLNIEEKEILYLIGKKCRIKYLDIKNNNSTKENFSEGDFLIIGINRAPFLNLPCEFQVVDLRNDIREHIHFQLIQEIQEL